MPDPQTPTGEPHPFDRLCAEVEEYEPLPEVVPGPADTTRALGRLDHDDSINAEILAGLVSP